MLRDHRHRMVMLGSDPRQKYKARMDSYRVVKMSNCQECDAKIPVPADSLEGEIVTCSECGAGFELVKSGEGFDLNPAQTVGEDWGQ